MIEEILPELSKAKVIRKVDLKEGFIQVELDEESNKLSFRHPGAGIAFTACPLESPRPRKFFR